MSVLPIVSTTGDPVFRSQSSSINTIKRFTRVAADASLKLNGQERIVNPGDDSLSFATSRNMRSQIQALKVVAETNQVHVTGLGLAIEGLEGMRSQLDKIKKLIIQGQTADSDARTSIQAEIDLALSQIDSTAQNTKLGSRSLLNGDSTIKGYSLISATGCIADFSARAQGLSAAATSGVQAVRVNRIGRGGSTRTLNDGRTVLSFRVSILSNDRAIRPFLSFQPGAGAGEFAEFRVTGKLGSATLRIVSSFTTFADNVAIVETFNALAGETGVVLTSGTGGIGLATVGFGDDEFIKIELLSADQTGASTIQFGSVLATSPTGTVQSAYGKAATATINGSRVKLGGEYGLTARYLSSGYDIEIDFSSANMSNVLGTPIAGAITKTVNIDLSQGVAGLLGSSGRSSEVVKYGYGTFTTDTLGRGSYVNTVTTLSGTAATTALNTSLANQVVGGDSVANLGSGGPLALTAGNLTGAVAAIDRAIQQVVNEQTRLGGLQGNFISAINRAEIGLGNLSSADADILGVDAATEITNLIQAQLGISTASSVLSQANAIQANIFSLLRG